MGIKVHKGAVCGMAAAAVLGIAVFPTVAAGTVSGSGQAATLVSTDSTYDRGLDLEAGIITTVEQDQRSLYAHKAITVADGGADIYASADEGSEVVGSLEKNAGCDVLGSEGSWTHVSSGGCEGYVLTESLAIGQDAQEYALENGIEGIVAQNNSDSAIDVYAQPSADADVIATVESQQETGALCTVNGASWVEVEVNDTTGYVPAEAVELETRYAEADALTEADKSAVSETSETVYATTQVNIRSDASEESTAVGVLEAGGSITRTGTLDNGWSRVDSNGQTAYIKSEFLTADAQQVAADNSETQTDTSAQADTSADASGSSQTAQTLNETVYATTAVRVRASASTDSNILGVLNTGDSLTRTAEADGWSTVSYNGSTGYVKSDYLSTSVPAQSAEDTSSSDLSSSDSSSLGQQIADFAIQFVGYPYVYGGNSLTNGVDCSGFAQQVYLHFGISIPRTCTAQAAACTQISESELQPGDLVFYGTSGNIGHVAIYLGNGRVVHASNPANGIMTSNMNYRTIYCFGRFR